MCVHVCVCNISCFTENMLYTVIPYNKKAASEDTARNLPLLIYTTLHSNKMYFWLLNSVPKQILLSAAIL